VAADVPAKHGPGEHGAALLACAVTGAAACAVLAGCSAGPGAQAQAQAQRSAVLPAAKKLYSQVTATGVGWIGTIIGGYETCGTDDPLATPSNDNSLQYTAQELMTPYSGSVAYPVFRRQVVEALNGIGWALRQTPSGSSPATYYTGQRDGTDLRLVELDNQPGLGPTATIFLSGACFDAGSSAQQLRGQSSLDNVAEPRPTATPTPRYS
jgi:hypothetical protein